MGDIITTIFIRLCESDSSMKLWPALKKAYRFLKEDNSALSWVLNVVIAFVVIKYLFYPGIGFLLGTSYPIVAVVSGSMEHDGSFEAWWQSTCYEGTGTVSQSDLYAEYGIDEYAFQEFGFRHGFNTGDLMILRSAEDVHIGDVVVFSTDNRAEPIIHRVVKIDHGEEKLFKTKGDHNCGSNPFETEIKESALLGEAWLRIPLLGWVKILFVKAVSWIVVLIR